VTLVHAGRLGFPGIREIYAETAREMTESVLAELSGGGYDLLISAAAISDYTLDSATEKIRSGDSLTLHLRPTEKLLAAVRDRHTSLTIVGFKLETASGDALIERAKAAMGRYGLDMVVANTVESMGGDESEVWIIAAKGDRDICHASGAKDVVASAILDCVGEPESRGTESRKP